MFSLGRMRCIICSALLCSSFQYAEADGNSTIPQTNYNCACPFGKYLYNLAPLQRTDGKPRFNVSGSGQWMFSYNPCASFSLGQPIGDCSGGDVAVCEWVRNESYQNIGSQSSFSCGNDTQHSRPQLEYTNKGIPGWKVIIRLKCNHRFKRIKDARFNVYDHKDQSNPREFILTHRCACPDGCRESPGSTTITPTPNTPTPTVPDNSKNIGVPVCIAAGSVLVVVFALYVIFRLIKGGDIDGQEGERLIGAGRTVEGGNNLHGQQPEDGRRSANLSQPMSITSTSTSDSYYSAIDDIRSVPV